MRLERDHMLKDITLERYVLSDTAREDYLASYEGNRFAESIRYVQSYPTELEILRDVLPHIQTPVQIISGRRDASSRPSTPATFSGRTPLTNMRRS
jgi:pimeloyl-ACP methyl ester carboxylesterase